jgi:hypothetical protein
MRPLTERLLQLAALVFLAHFGYALVERAVVQKLQAQNRAAECQRARGIPAPNP